MKLRIKKYILFLTLVFIAGCGNYRYVRISYPNVQPTPIMREALGSLYVVVKTKPAKKKSNGFLKSLLGGSRFDINGALLAKSISQDFKAKGAGIAAFRVTNAESMKFDLAEEVKPRGILEINLHKPTVSIDEIEREIEYYDKKTKSKKKGKSRVWVYEADLRAKAKLISFPDLTVIDEWTVHTEYTKEHNSKDLKKEIWFENIQEKVFSKMKGKFSSRYFGFPVSKNRRVFFKEKDAESEKAYKLSQKRKWNKAEKIWLKRIKEKSDWRDILNMGVAKELKKDYSAALKYYRLAKTKSAGVKEAKGIKWKGIFKDIDFATSGAIKIKKSSFKWFDYKIAVLPFSSEVVSMDGPVMLRKMISEGLKEEGYNILDIEKTDALLRENGYSDGGQLRWVKKKKICRWLNVDAVIAVNITDFNDIKAGLYNKRKVAGNLVFWSLADKKEVLTVSEEVLKIKMPKSLVKGLIGQVAKSWLEKLKNKPLAYESVVFSRQVVGKFPGKI
ncbi:MAG: DUF799 family lipoprotein [Elusimicrobiota bacterium]|nr:DUF799 family lipoprotein [Elusimicrobiota bacterium]